MIGDAYHMTVWLDHRVANIYGVTRESVTELFSIDAPDQGRGTSITRPALQDQVMSRRRQLF
jgi:hypothetical protein